MKRVFAFAVLLGFAAPLLSGLPAQAETREDAFRNFSTAPNYIKIRIEDPENGERLWVLFESWEFNVLLLERWNELVGTDAPRSEEAYDAFIRERVEERPLRISLRAFTSILATEFGSREQAELFLQKYSFEHAYSLSELGFATKEEMVTAFVNGRHAKSGARVWEPRVIALLLDLGYNVGRGDIAPDIFINEVSAPQ